MSASAASARRSTRRTPSRGRTSSISASPVREPSASAAAVATPRRSARISALAATNTPANTAKIQQQNGNLLDEHHDDQHFSKQLWAQARIEQDSGRVQFNNEQYVDDITVEFLYKPHTITALGVIIAVLLYFAYTTDTEHSSTLANVKLGISVAIFFVLMLGLLVFPSGPFVRPHPLVWRFAFGVAVVYEIFLIVLLYQNKHDARQSLSLLYPELGQPIKERTYADDCSITYDTIRNSCDIFLFGHFFGWMIKSLMLRDQLVCWFISVQWELIEMAFTHMLPNFAECWWDQWILDVLLANGLGIYVGHKLCEYLEMKDYKWSGYRDIPDTLGKVKRGLLQFTPASWTVVRWESNKNIKRFITMQLIILFMHINEINAFFLKHILWVPPPCKLNFVRLFVWCAIGPSSFRQIYAYITDPTCKRLGYQLWLAILIIFTEVAVIVKFGENEFPHPMPTNVFWGWIGFGIIYAIYCIVNIRQIHSRQHEEQEQKKAN